MSDSLTPGTRIGVYEVVAAIGAGGMGEVYRAVDTALGRDVAIKILSAAFARDPDRLLRFEREARTLASLNHPNIAQVYSFEGRAIVMELLEGESLRDRLSSGPLPVRKAVEYGSQIARGLAAAHERGVIHRDLKPENVFILPDGHVKLLDFGLSRQIAPPTGSGSETLAAGTRNTDPGTVLGTVGYMAPEQVRARPLDARTDLFALGAVLHEMLTGRRAFRRETPAETMTAILKDDPPELTASRSDISPALDRIVRHCLEKNPIERFQTARDVAFALDALSGSAPAATAATVAGRPRRRALIERLAWAALVLTLGGIIVWLGATRSRSLGSARPPAYRTSVPLPDGVRITSSVVPAVRLSIAPDGRHVAYVGRSESTFRDSIWVQSLVDGDAHEIEGTVSAWGPFWSPDSRQVAFTDSSSTILKRADAEGGTPIRMSAAAGYGTWGPRDAVIVSQPPPISLLLRTSTLDSPPVELLKGAGTERFRFPFFIPGTADYLYARRNPNDPSVSGLWLGSLGSTDAQLLIPSSDEIHAFTANGYLVFARDGSIFAQPFDAGSRTLSGRPTVLAEGVDGLPIGGAAFSVSQANALVYLAQPEQGRSRLALMDREGRTLSTVSDEADYSNVEFSPDGHRVAVSVMDPSRRTRDIFLVDLARNVRQRLTLDPGEERAAIWSPDGRRVIFNSRNLDLYARPSDFTGADEPILVGARTKDPRGVSADGRQLLYRESGPTSNDLWVMPLDGGTPSPVLDTPFDENYGVFSPDARSVAYVSDESGRTEVYVISLEPGGGKVQISTAGGTFPRWRRDGREILYLGLDQMLMSAAVSGSGSQFRAETVKPLFHMDTQPGPGAPFDVTADGQRFIVNVAIPSKAPPSLTLLTNWTSLVRPGGL